MLIRQSNDDDSFFIRPYVHEVTCERVKRVSSSASRPAPGAKWLWGAGIQYVGLEIGRDECQSCARKLTSQDDLLCDSLSRALVCWPLRAQCIMNAMCPCSRSARAARKARALANPADRRRLRRRLRVRVRASQEPDAGTETMSLEEAETTLNVSRSADFETIMRAKEAQMRKAGQDQEKSFRVRLYCATRLCRFGKRCNGGQWQGACICLKCTTYLLSGSSLVCQRVPTSVVCASGPVSSWSIDL